MTAKEMFEKLGYKYIEHVEKLYGDIQYNKQFEFAEITIYFNNKNKEVEFSSDVVDIVINIDLEELKAINKQIEELGWND